MDLGTEQTGWLVEFLGGPWDRQTGFYDREPGEVIHAPLEPPLRYRLAIKLGNSQLDAPLRHLIYEAERP
jgi:hypothetical protein